MAVAAMSFFMMSLQSKGYSKPDIVPPFAGATALAMGRLYRKLTGWECPQAEPATKALGLLRAIASQICLHGSRQVASLVKPPAGGLFLKAPAVVCLAKQRGTLCVNY